RARNGSCREEEKASEVLHSSTGRTPMVRMLIELPAGKYPALELSRVFDGIFRPGLGLEAGLGDRLAGAFADAVGAVADFAQGNVDLAQELPIFFDQAEREFLLVVVGAHVGHVDRQVGEVAARGAAERF